MPAWASDQGAGGDSLADRTARQRALVAAEARLASDPDDTAVRFNRACLLWELGRTDDARQAYLDLLGRTPHHAGALNNLGTLLYQTGYRTAARTAYGEAVARHPDDPAGHVNLGNLLAASGEPALARAHFETALRLAPDLAEAHQGLSHCLAEAGEHEAAERHRLLGYGRRPLTHLPYHGESRPVRLLQLVAAAGGNIPTAAILDNRVFAVTVLVADHFDPAQPLPPHDLVFNTIGDADLCAPALAAARRLLRKTGAPVLNPPARIQPTGRVAVARRLAGLPGVVAPRAALFPRRKLAGNGAAALLADAGFGLPLLLRSRGFHTGRHFVRVEAAAEIAEAVAALPGDEILAIACLDARGADGLARKYRVMMIDGRLFPLHLAISQDWKVHYFTADMAERPDHRAEEAAFLADMAGALGEKAMAGLEAICARLGLDYGGIDFGLNSAGDVLLFEANATMAILPPPADSRWDYRRAAIGDAIAAVARMLKGRVAQR